MLRLRNLLPPLTALPAFEASARLLSFTQAAQELNVTQAAISHQIKSLEEQLGIRMFRRGPRGLLLTDAGQSYLPDVREAFPGVHLQPKGLVATEAFVTLPLGDLRPLAIRSHFFEFQDQAGNVLPAWS